MDVCYRHPKRETGVRCSNCDRPICPDCMTSTSVGMRCPECARQSTKVRTMRSLSGDPTLTYVLIAINVVASLGSSFGGNVGNRGTLTQAGELSRGSIASGDYWTLVTNGFLHRGLFHLLSNMLALWILGSMLEPALGRARFGLIYAVALLFGSLGVLLYGPEQSVGASGAVFGLMGAAGVVARSRGLNLMESGLGLWLGINILITFTIPNISIGAHLGGLVGGAIAALVLVELGERGRLPRYLPELLCGALGAAALVASVALYA
ncbi:MAG TPA: rhomboid family intramembrane serine protease [Thermoleophilaceae bacterium]|jgi:membrane associated rhomboid family serine protease|nr:rhomboid family intramembrane serine protease [Thermoleophilaceae bacterium]